MIQTIGAILQTRLVRLLHCSVGRYALAVAQELLSFQGCEIYDKEWPELIGRPHLHAHAQFAMHGCTPCLRQAVRAGWRAGGRAGGLGHFLEV